MTDLAGGPAAAVTGPRGTRIDLDDVCRVFRVGETSVSALGDINLHVDETAFVVVLGASGSGKTTLLNIIGALDVPTSGRVRIAREDITAASRRQRAELRRHTVSWTSAPASASSSCCRPRRRPARPSWWSPTTGRSPGWPTGSSS